VFLKIMYLYRGMKGIVISEEESPSTLAFKFIALEDVKKGEYISIRTDEGLIIGSVNELYFYNEYLSKSNVLTEVPELSKVITREENVLIGVCNVLGLYKEGKFVRALKPPSPGSIVEDVEDGILQAFFGFVKEGIDIGKVKNRKLKVVLDVERTLGKHMAILAMSGAGKSNLVSIMFEQLIEKSIIPSIIIDIHGEYTPFKNIINATEIKGEDIKIPFKSLSSSLFRQVFPNFSDPQEFLLSKAISKYKKMLKKRAINPNLKHLYKIVKEIDESKGIKNAVLRKIKHLHRLKIIGEETFDFQQLLKFGSGAIVNLSSISNERIRNLKVYYILKKLFGLRKKNLIPPFVVFIEEAHNLAPETIAKEMGLAKKEIERIAREGRKFGVSLVIVSQRPAHLSQTALAQCSTHVFLKIVNPNDLRYIESVSEFASSDVMRSIPSLDIGEAIITGSAVNAPVIVRIKKRREELENYKNKGLNEMLKEWKDKKGIDYSYYK